MTAKHLKKHRVNVPEVTDLFTMINKKVQKEKDKQRKRGTLNRHELISGDTECLRILDKVKKFISITS